MEQIVCKDLNFIYPGCETPALRDISFTVNRSEFVLLCGRSGCGKSTLLRHLKKNLMPYGNLTGSVRYCGHEIEEMDDRKNAAEVGFVQQNPDNQIVTDKVWHELAFGLESLGLDNRTMKQRVAEMASFFGIQTWFRKNVSELSGGQKQLLNLASIMAMQPKLLILDEPTSQLDPIAASDFIATLKKINTELGTTIIISEHRLEELFPLADRVLVMNQGRLEIDDDPRQAAIKISSGICGEMFFGLPAVIKVAGHCDSLLSEEAAAVGNESLSEGTPSNKLLSERTASNGLLAGNCPLTVREGRLWMESRLGEPNGEESNEEESLDISMAESGNKSVGLEKKGIFEKFHRKKAEKEEAPAIFMKDVRFRYPGTKDDILRGVDLSVKKGELFAVLGGNGVGKTTTLKVLTKIVKPDRGIISINGRKLESLSDAELFSHGLSLLPQNPQALFTEITVREELTEALYEYKISDEEKERKVTEMEEKMELSNLDQSHPYDLSGGEQQRLALGKILLREPTILLLDEPTKGLDPFFKRTLAGIFADLCRQGITILMVSHDIEFCAEYADHCALFFDGEIVSCAEPVDFFAGNRFYTTSANRLAGQWFPRAVTWEEVARLCAEAIM